MRRSRAKPASVDQETPGDDREDRAGRVHHQMPGQAMHRDEVAQALRPELVVQQWPGNQTRRPRTLHGAPSAASAPKPERERPPISQERAPSRR